MKKIILAVIFLIGSTTIFSQIKTKFGLRTGANFSTITHASLNYKTNAYFGAFLNVHFSDLYELQPELVYTNQGGKSKFNDVGTVNIAYLSIGIANKFFVIQNTGFHLILAPSIDLDLDDSFLALANRNDGEGNDATFVDLAFALGIGYEFNNGLAIEARYKLGAIDVYSGAFHNFTSNELENENQFNRVFQIGVSYKFNFSKKE